MFRALLGRFVSLRPGRSLARQNWVATRLASTARAVDIDNSRVKSRLKPVAPFSFLDLAVSVTCVVAVATAAEAD